MLSLLLPAVAALSCNGLPSPDFSVALHGGRVSGGPYQAEAEVGCLYSELEITGDEYSCTSGFLAASPAEWILPCSADVTGDGEVTVNDVLLVIAEWGTSNPKYDINEDGLVGTDDLLAILDAWGSCP